MTPARVWHTATAVTALAAVLLQLLLVVTGASVLDEAAAPSLGLRLARFVAYFTVQSNVLVLVSVVPLAEDPDHDGAWWRVLRAAALVGITVTALVHLVLLRPLLDLDGWSQVADTLLHVVVPVLAVVGWALFGPRPRTGVRAVSLALVWPVVWLVETVLVGALTGWFPYPFLDYRAEGWAAVLGASGGVTILFVAVGGALLWADRRAPRRPRGSRSRDPRVAGDPGE